ncbi:hypothetical protein [Serratia sp. Se-RSBMAAmG]|uniref:hypothetical protein n=1 Tax=Serratia sp. Se-RSBMAAmG TaxID=3043305 RepID=UPI0024AE9EF2|nr:hypothetical protein [Serratia sp. Se-RSBMAAmG]MDI6976256.1 hypothetical protein [Serratia sp. Se-RSBMAAmG]
MKTSIVSFILKILAIWFLVDFGKSGNVSDYTTGMVLLWLFIFCRQVKFESAEKRLHGIYMLGLAFNLTSNYFFFNYAFYPVCKYAGFLNSIAILLLILNLVFSTIMYFILALKTFKSP